jgi:F0F1-type ATP synthase assembly protein I
MIKSLLDADENPPPDTKVIIEETVLRPVAEEKSGENHRAETFKSANDSAENAIILEIPENVEDIRNASDIFDVASKTPDFELKHEAEDSSPVTESMLENVPEAKTETIREIKPEINPRAEIKTETTPETMSETKTEKMPELSANETDAPSFQIIDYKPQTTAETIRDSGLAYSAAIVLVASVIFMLILGWFADLILGSSPWGVVGGIILGSIIGFVQFFRTTSQIFKK